MGLQPVKNCSKKSSHNTHQSKDQASMETKDFNGVERRILSINVFVNKKIYIYIGYYWESLEPHIFILVLSSIT